MAIANSCDVPIILYNIPGRSASNMNADTTTRLAHESNKFIGIKEASNDLYQIMLILKNKPANFALWAGDDYITLPVIACGGHGVISVIANALPKMFTTMVNNALNFDLKTAKQQNDQLLDLYKILFAEGNPVGIKTALAFQNVTSPEVRLPLTAMSDDGVRLLTKNLQPLLPLN
jgi:4-hydroxy-tetrahydrodipicolinate synthase